MEVEHKGLNKSSSKPQPVLSAEELLSDLANLSDKGVSRFRDKWRRWYSRYGDEDILTRRDELRLFWTHRHWEYPEEPYEFIDSSEPRTSKQELRKRETERRKWRAERRRREEEWYAQHPQAIRPTVPKRVKKLYDDWQDHVVYLMTEAPYEIRGDPDDLEEVICAHWLGLEPSWWRVIWQKNRKTIGFQLNCLPGMLAATCLRVVERLGYCRNPKCARPYFFLQRRDQLYCSPECAKPARRASKLKWWHEHRGRKNIGVVGGPVFLGSPGKPRHSPLRPPLKGKRPGGTD